MPERTSSRSTKGDGEQPAAPARSLWSGAITFGLVSIPVDLLSAIRPRQTAMKLVDKDGHPLGRRYHCSKEGAQLDADELVRGYETAKGKSVVVTDEELESVAPEMSRGIELRSFAPLEQIPPLYFERPYFLVPAGKSAKAYHLLAETMERTGRAGVGSFVMRGHEYLVAIISEDGVLRAGTLRYADEIRSPAKIGLPKRAKAAASKVTQFSRAIDALTRDKLDLDQFEDEEADALLDLAQKKLKARKDVIRARALEPEDGEAGGGGGKVIDLMEVLRKSLSKNAVVTNASGADVISLADRRERREQAQSETTKSAKTNSTKTKSSKKRAPARKAKARTKTSRKRAKGA